MNGLLPAAAVGSEGVDDMAGMAGAAEASRLVGMVSAAGADAIRLGWLGLASESETGWLAAVAGSDDGPSTVGSAS